MILKEVIADMNLSKENLEEEEFAPTQVATPTTSPSISYHSNDVPLISNIGKLSRKRKLGPTLRSQKRKKAKKKLQRKPVSDPEIDVEENSVS